MTASYIRLPDDGVGKKTRTRNRTVGADDIHEPYMLALVHERILTTAYYLSTGALVIAAAADAANVGRMYLFNDADSTVLLAVRAIHFSSQMGSVLAVPTSPRITIKRYTGTGTAPSSTETTGTKMDTSLADKNAGWALRNGVTNMGTVTEGAEAMAFYPVASATAVAYSPPSPASRRLEPESAIILRAGEGIMVKQSDAATASDTRRFTVDFEVEQYTV